jgi:nitroreductase
VTRPQRHAHRGAGLGPGLSSASAQQFPAYDAKGFYDGLPQLVEPHARLNASLQAAYLILAARALGLDAGPMAGFDAAAVDAAFFPDGQWRSLLLVNLGYGVTEGLPPRGPRWNSNRRLPSSDRITHVKLLAAMCLHGRLLSSLPVFI